MDNEKEYLMGSQYFFNELEGFQPHDKDILMFWDDIPVGKYSFSIRGDKMDFRIVKRLPKDEFIKINLEEAEKLPMVAGKFLIPEINAEIGFTIDDLKQFETTFSNMDDRHKYEKIIYDSYIVNNAFILTEEQRENAYKEYKKYRNN